MNPRKFLILGSLAVALLAPANSQTKPAASPSLTGFPFQDETLRYSVNWPSGLSLGDVSFSAHKTSSGWSLEATAQAGVPGFAIADRYASTMTKEYCSLKLERDTSHGNKKGKETTTFDNTKMTAHRVTTLPSDGGKSDFEISNCARDALTFIYFARKEMGQGRVAPQQTVFLGGAYSVRLEYTGAVNVKASGQSATTDHVMVYVKGPKSDFNFELFFARDAARTPLLVKIPLSMGTLSMELVR